MQQRTLYTCTDNILNSRLGNISDVFQTILHYLIWLTLINSQCHLSFRCYKHIYNLAHATFQAVWFNSLMPQSFRMRKLNKMWNMWRVWCSAFKKIERNQSLRVNTNIDTLPALQSWTPFFPHVSLEDATKLHKVKPSCSAPWHSSLILVFQYYLIELAPWL